MIYNTNLQDSNAKLQALLNKVNELPEAGEGSGTIIAEVIPFTLVNTNDSTTYQCYAELGMTLSEWFISKYNNVSPIIDYESIYSFSYKDPHSDTTTNPGYRAMGTTTLAPYVTYYIDAMIIG